MSAQNDYAQLPFKASIPVEPFKIQIPDKDLDELKTLLKLSRVSKPTFENQRGNEKLGVSREWLQETKQYWETQYDWRKQEARLNGVPHFIAKVKTQQGKELSVHFMALFSKRKDAVPIVMSHGWPGMFIEFLGVLEQAKAQYSPDDLPYHLVIPSVPGYAWSSPPPVDHDFSHSDAAYVFDQLMTGLGFEAYAAQGGDVGSKICQLIARNHSACKALHQNFRNMTIPPEGTPERAKMSGPPPPPMVIKGLAPFGYALEQATKPATIGFVVGSNPISLLCWTGEKYILGSDVTPDIDTILTFVSLYWFTDTYPSSIWPYRYYMGAKMEHPDNAEVYESKPCGYSLFPKEIAQTPPHWIKAVSNLVWHNVHPKEARKNGGGHFAALEKPKEFWADIEAFIKAAWNTEPKPKASM